MKKKTLFAALVAILLPLSVCGQAINSSYFIDNSLQRVRLNPAFSPDASVGYFGLILGTGVDFKSNLGIDDFLFNKDGQLYTYLNKNVTVEEFAERFKTDPNLNFNLNEQLLGLGFRIGMLYITAGLDVRADLDLNLPKDLLLLTKQGMATTDQVYDFSGFAVKEASFLEGHVGASIDLSGIIPGLSIGGRAKYLLAANYAGANMAEGTLRMSEDKWMIKTDAKAIVAMKGIAIDKNGISFPNGMSGIGFCGSGLLLDFGAEWKLNLELGALTGINASFSMRDIGKCTIKDRYTTVYKSGAEAEFDGLKGIKPGEDFSTNFDNVIQDFKAVLNVEKTDEHEAVEFNFTPTILAGLEVTMFDNHLSTGFLYSRVNGFDELQIIESAKLGRLNAAVSYSMLNSKRLGFYLGYTPRRKGFNIYLASDGLPTRYTPKYDLVGLPLPLGKLNANVRFGVNLCFETRDRK